MKKIYSIFKNRYLVMAVGFVILLLLVWFAGPFVGLGTVLLRVMVMALAVMSGIVVLLIRKINATKGAAQIENALKEQAAAQMAGERPDRREEIQELQEQLNSAITTLKKSGGGKFLRKSAALYDLPWYMMIGPPASGKSTAILHSGLSFPYVNESEAKIKGVGGTRNCDWWFTNEAVLLDTAGRYTTEEEGQKEWLGFLDMLKKARKRKPINGVIVGISIPDLMGGDEDACEDYGKKIRKRIDELIKQLDIRFPVYVVFTKCDLLQGFVEFFGDMSREERSQVWGCTFSEEELRQAPVQTLFENDFDKLYQSLNRRRLTRLGYEIKVENKQAVYFFPLQYRSIKARLSRFLGALFEPNPYQEQPIFRGFYFTSGTQEGAPIDNVIGAMSRAFGVSGVFSGAQSENTGETKSYFLKNLFTQVIFPDQGIAGASSSAARRARLIRMASFGGSLAIAVALIVSLTVSFIANKRLISNIGYSARQVSKIDWNKDDLLSANLQALDNLRGKLETLYEYQSDGPPLMMRWGLYRGDTILSPVRDIYLFRLSEILLEPMGLELEAELAQVSQSGVKNLDDYSHYYDMLKAYLMLADPARADTEFLGEMFRALLDSQVEPDIREIMERQSDFYLRHMKAAGVPVIELEPRLVDSARSALKTIPTIQRVFLTIRNKGNRNFEPYTLQKAMGHRSQNLLVSKYEIPGFYTPEAWKKYFKEASAKAGEELLKEDWILADLSPGQAEDQEDAVAEEVEKELRDLYMKEYVRQWRSFIEGISLRSFTDMEDAAGRLHVLAGEDSPLVLLLQSVVEQTSIGETPGVKVGKTVTKLFSKATRKLGIGKKALQEAAKPEPASLVQKRFMSLREFVKGRENGSDDDIAELQVYLEEIAKIQSLINDMVNSDNPQQEARYLAGKILSGGSNEELHQVLSAITSMLRDFNTDEKMLIEPLLKQPVIHVLSAVLVDAQKYLDNLWRVDVYDVFRKSLQMKYPFSELGQDSALIDVAEFFHPSDGVVRRFYNDHLRQFLVPSGRTWRAKTWQGRGIRFSESFFSSMKRIRRISDSLFPRGSVDPTATFELYPIPTAGLSETMLLVDGQRYRYRMGPQAYKKFTWPGEAISAGAKISITDERSGLREEKAFEGRWGFFRLLDAAKVTAKSSTVYRLEWIFNTARGKYSAKFNLKASSYKNPFVRGLFDNFKCPKRISP